MFIFSFLAPAVSIYAVLVLWPLVGSFLLAGYRWRGVSAHRTFVGLDNFRRLSHDETFWRAALHNVLLLGGAGTLIIAVAVAVAHGLNRPGRIAKALRSVVLFPQMISVVAVATLWSFLFNPRMGLLNSALESAGFGQAARVWLGEPGTALPSVGAAFVWSALGFYVLLFSAGLRSLSSDVFEAAALDGAAGLRMFWRVTWPMLWSVKRVAIVHLSIGIVNVFALVFLMTGGGPDRATEVMLTYLYESAFANKEFGYAATVAVANFAIAMLLSLVVLFRLRRDPAGARS